MSSDPTLVTSSPKPATQFPHDPRVATGPNSLATLAHRSAAGGLGWRGPLLMLLVRLPMLLVCFALALAAVRGAHLTHPAAYAEGLTRFDLPILADITSVGLLMWLTRREGLRLRDLFCVERAHFLRNLIRDLALGAALFISAYIALFAVSAAITFATLAASSPSQRQAALAAVQGSAAINPLGMGAQIGISAFLLPLTTALAEELIYRGYALPRLQVLTGRRWLAILLTAAAFGAQHLAYGLLSWPSAISGVLSALFAGLLFGALYQLTRQRLLPLVVIHWQSNLISLGLLPIFLAAFIK